jgi:hypothetical protein
VNQYRIMYRWQGREYITTMPGHNAAHALMFADIQMMPGAQAFAVERVR